MDKWNLATGITGDKDDNEKGGSSSSSHAESDSKADMIIDTSCLVDGFFALYEECTHDSLNKIKNVSNFVNKYRDTVAKLKRRRMNNADFEVKDIIGRGHFGEVRVVKLKSTGDVYAMKVIRKSDVLSQPNISFFEEERNIMASIQSPWLTKLHYAFQDSINLYLVMDFYPGGDLLSLLSRHDNVLDEEMAKFYLAEVAFAINNLHCMGYMHRDIKPENILLDQSGHIRLADFGSAAKMDLNQKVSANIPVGTPDYVAPELLTSISKGMRSTYGPEVDWWSLGVCAYEIMFGTVPFTNKQMSTVETYASIMNYKKSLRFPPESCVSSNAIDFINGLLTDSDQRLSWEGIKSHPYFSGISWDNLQSETPAFVPSINGLDDTSNFDEFEKRSPQPDLDAFKPKHDFTGRDLPFVGFTYFKHPELTTTNCKRLVEVTQCVENVSSFIDKDKEIARLKELLEKERKSSEDTEATSVSLMESMISMNKEIKDIECELQEAKLEELKANIVLIESDYEKVMNKLLEKERKLEKVESALEEAEAQRLKLKKERRKSREDQQKDLMLIELRDETWQSLLDEKQAMIEDLRQKVHEYENLLEAYEENEEKQATEVHQLQHKMNTSLLDAMSMVNGNKDKENLHSEETKVTVDTFHHSWCPSNKKLVLQVTLQAGRCSFVDNKTVEKLQELQKMVDQYTEMSEAWKEKEENLRSKLSALESENKMLLQKEGLGHKMKENLMEKLSTYQQEVHSQKTIIKDLQSAMSSYLAKTSHHSETESQLKEVLQKKLELEKELICIKEEVDKLRQSALNKTNEMEAIIVKLEEQRIKADDYKNRYDCQVAVTEEKVSSYEEKFSEATSTRQQLEKREAALITQVELLQGLVDDRSAEVERLDGHIADIQTHLQRLQQKNTDLQVEVEKLQKSCCQNEVQKTSKLALNFQINNLTQSKSDLEHQLTVVMRRKQATEDKLFIADKGKERLIRRIERLEKIEKEKQELELKLDRIPMLERENRHLQTKAGQVIELEKDKLNLEEKIENLQMDLKKEKVNKKSAIEERKDLERKLEQLKTKRMEEDGEEMSKLKVQVTLLESMKKEKDIFEKKLDQLNAIVTKLEDEKEKTLTEKQTMELDIKKLQEEKTTQDKCNAELKQEISASDRLVNNLNGQVTRLETCLGTLEADKYSKESETKKLSLAVNRLKQLVDKLELDKQGQENERNRSNIEEKRNFFDSLRKEKAKVQKQSEAKADKDEVHRLREQIEDKEEELLLFKKEAEQKERETYHLKFQVETQTANVLELKEQMDELSKIDNDLSAQLEKQSSVAKLAEEEKDKLKEELKKLSAGSSMRISGDVKFEKMKLEKRIEELVEETNELKTQLSSLKAELKTTQWDGQKEPKIKSLQEEYDEYKKDMEIRLGASKFSNGDIPAFLRHELNESNLALSEARSLLSAAKRQELELRERIEQLQKSLDNKAVESASCLQNAKDAMTELKSLMSQNDTLRRQNKILEEKHTNLQRQQGSSSAETIRLLEEINYKEKQFGIERKKSETLSQVCQELEQQIKELEHAVTEADKRETEWENIKKTYEKAVSERDNDLDGASERIEAITMARSQSSEKTVVLKQQLVAAKALHKADIESQNHKLREEKAKSDKIAVQMEEMVEKKAALTEIIQQQKDEMEKMNQDKLNMKQELTEALSDSCNYRKENLKLRKHLDDAMHKFELILGEKVSLENFAEALQGLHFLDKYKFESTIGQQMKLIDYLQDLYHSQADKKKKGNKLFNTQSKGNGKNNGPLPITLQECPKCSMLLEQLEKLKVENTQINQLLKQKSSTPDLPTTPSHNIKANLVVNVTPSAMRALSGTSDNQASKLSAATSSTNSLASVESSASSCSSVSSSSCRQSSHAEKSVRKNYSKPPQTPRDMSQRMCHNIPHRFTTGLNSRATKCGLCLGSVHFVRQASKCQECKMVVHPKCASSVPANCGLPTEYVRYFVLMTSRIGQDSVDRECELDQSMVKMEGWLKVPRIGKSGWENRYCVLEGTWLTFYLDDKNSNPVDSFDLDPADADVTVHSAVTKAELTNTASSDLHYIIRLDQDPLTTCWPGRYVYLMTTSFQDKQRWVASLEAVVKAAQCNRDVFQHKSETLTVLSLKDGDCRDLNCTLTISSQVVLVGTDDGLYAFNPEALMCKKSQMTQLSGFGSVHQMALAKGVDLILILTGPERRLIMLENKLVKSRMSQTLGGETTPFSFRTVEGLQECTVFDVGLWNKSSYLCVGTPKKVYLMRYNPSLSMYCVRKEFACSEPCSCVCLAENYAIIGTDRFYKINMEHPSLLDFVDRQDSSLAFAAFEAANHKSFPLAVVQVSPTDLPLEFLLCFHEFGVFVDHRGQRSRAQDVKWSGFPLAFVFVEPFLYVTYFNTVQATVIPTDRSTSRGKQTVMDFPTPRNLGPASSPGTVYISTNKGSNRIMEIVQIKGKEDFVSETASNKENWGSVHGLSPSHITYNAQVKTPKKSRVHQLRKQGSLTSVDSNSSCCTFASVESDV